MSVRDIVMRTESSGTGSSLNIADVFSTYLYTGNNGSLAINNGIDLSTNGGLVWIKCRNAAAEHILVSNQTGIGIGSTNYLKPNSTPAPAYAGNVQAQFNTNGYTISGNAGVINDGTVPSTYASWTFRKAPKFLDIVTYTGDGSIGKQISHSLGTTPGMVIIKNTSVASNWGIWHANGRGGSLDGALALNLTDTVITPAFSASGSTFNVYQGTTNFKMDPNISGNTYVAYLFADDATTGGIIRCGAYTGNGTSQSINIGWEPQWILHKNASQAVSWAVIDSLRGMTADGAAQFLYANITQIEGAGTGYLKLTGAGFDVSGTSIASNTNGDVFIYVAIRGMNKTPTSGTQVFSATASTSSSSISSSFTTDLIMSFVRPTVVTTTYNRMVQARILGNYKICNPNSGAVGTFTDTANFITNTGVILNNNATYPSGYLHLLFKRAPGFMDVVAYTGTQTNISFNHNLGVVPELILAFDFQTFGTNSIAYHKLYGFNCNLYISSDAAASSYNTWGSNPTATQFSLSSDYIINRNNNKFLAILFATLAGISKVDSYTGNGSSQTINCGFSAGARFILIKCTSAVGDWFVWDTSRGIASSNDPHLSINAATAEVTTDDSIDPDNSGFIVNQVAATNINVTSATYIFLAIS